jgi:1-deoxy-D-xylulose-5-phosphate reductoisomerase
MKGLCILGSTGSIGQNSLRVVGGLQDRFRVVSLSAGKNVELLVQQIEAFGPRLVSVMSAEGAESLRDLLRSRGYQAPLEIRTGEEGSIAAASHPEVDVVLSASHGVTGLLATFAAVRAGKRVGLANKETLVAAGELVMQEAAKTGAEVLPVDSEHCALHQCLRAGEPREVVRLILTGSGGPFLKTRLRDFGGITPEQALRHPIWRMGGRITIDSATLMNKGLEIIEASWLFGLRPQAIEVLIHPESIVHSMIEFKDHCLLAQLAVADMRIPIQYALTYPERLAVDGDELNLNLVALRRLHFRKPDFRRFPCLELGRAAIEAGGAMPCALNAADEVAVAAFLERRLPFVAIPGVIEEVMRRTPTVHLKSMEEVLECDREARRRAAEAVAACLMPGA